MHKAIYLPLPAYTNIPFYIYTILYPLTSIRMPNFKVNVMEGTQPLESLCHK